MNFDKKTVKQQNDRNLYGIALQEYQLGYLYEKYIEELNSEEAIQYVNEFEGSVDEDTVKLVRGGASMIKTRAVAYFKEAYRNFEDVNHLKGQYLSKLHELRIVSGGIDLNNDELIKQEK